MFLRRGKPAPGTISRPTKSQTQEEQDPKKVVKALGGWDEDIEEDKSNKYSKPSETITKKVATTNIFGDEQYVETKIEEKQSPSSTLYSLAELSQLNDLEHQIRLVDEVTQPGGIKIKPSESLLSEFSQAAKTLDKNYIGSLLISKLQEGFPYAVKAKALYTIQYLSKKNQTYKEYFQQFLDEIRNQPQPSQNTAAYNNILNEVLNFIENGGSQKSNVQSNMTSNFTFDGPDYNEDLPYAKDQGLKFLNMKKQQQKNDKKYEQKSKKGITKTFISPGEAKKIKKDNIQTEETSLIDTGSSATSDKTPQVPSNSVPQNSNSNLNIFDLDFGASTPAKEQPKPQLQPLQVPQNSNLYQNANFYQTPNGPVNMNPQQYQQYQQYLMQQQLMQQQFIQKQSQQPVANITGDQLYSMYKK